MSQNFYKNINKYATLWYNNSCGSNWRTEVGTKCKMTCFRGPSVPVENGTGLHTHKHT